MREPVAAALAFDSGPRRSRQRLLRIWTAPVSSADEPAYLAFAHGRSRSMLLSQPGCEGVYFLRLDESTQAVVTVWQDDASILACERSPTYRGTVEELMATGLIRGQTQLAVVAVEPPLLAVVLALLECDRSR